MSQAAALQTEQPLDASTFFESMLPAILAERAQLATMMKGRISFTVHGEGAWTLTLGRNAGVEADLDFDADLILAFSSAGFAALMAGAPIDPDGDEPVCMGDESLLEKLGRLLVAPSEGLVSARLMSV